MEETLTLARVIENINYVYGQRLLLAIFALFLLEIIVLGVIKRNNSAYFTQFRNAVFLVAFLISIVLAWRAKPYVAYDKFECADTVCSARYILKQKDYEDFRWADLNIYKYHYYDKYSEELVGSDFETKFGVETITPVFDETVLCKETFKDYILQVAACFLIYATGYFIVKSVFKERYKIFSSFLAAPIGASVLVFLTLLIHILGVKYCHISVACLLVLLWCGIVIYIRKNEVKMDKSVCFTLLVALLLIGILSVARFYQFSGDSRWQLIFAMNLLDEGAFSPWAFAQATTFGFWGISLHAFALIFGVDYLYAYFALVNIAGIGIYISSICLLIKKENRTIGVLFSLLGIIVLILNYDFEFYSFSVLSNASMGVLLLSLVALTLVACERQENVALLLALMTFSLLTTRVEGVCYVALFMVIPFERKGCLKLATIISGIEIIVWQIAQFVYSDGTGVDGWNKSTGIVLFFVGIALIVEPYLIKIDFIVKIKRYYKIIYILTLLLIIAVGFYYDYGMAKDNFLIFLSHMSVSKYSNSLSLWCFLLLIIPMLIDFSREESILFIGMAYYLLVFGISIFRTGNPLNTELSDSFRRIICQMMPMSMWLVTYYAGMDNENNIC